jgi:hypothetical protein
MKFAIALLMLLVEVTAMSQQLTAYDLQCENDPAPLSVDAGKPRLSWKLKSSAKGDRQTAYQLLVASSADKLAADQGDLWDSGKVDSPRTLQIEYAGKALQSTQQAHWKLRVWDRNGKESAWSDRASWSMGLLSPGDWKAKWIAADPSFQSMPVFRKQFATEKKLSRAVVYVCGLGQFELHLNGAKAGEDVLQPGWTTYSKTRLYCAYDVTMQCKSGENQIDVMLGNGMYHVPKTDRYKKLTGSFGQPMLIAQLHLTFEDGTEQIIATDRTWQCAAGPTTYSHIFGGEDYDARLESPTQWCDAIEQSGVDAVLAGSTRSAPVIRVQREFNPVTVTHPKDNTTVYDFGQNCSMIPRIRVKGKAGATVRLIPGELIKDGLVSQKSTGGPVYFNYTCKGEGEETWSPKFTYFGARYVQVETSDAEILDIKSFFICSTMPAAGTFECSNDLFNRTYMLIDWAIRSNAMSVLTDCPHRERLGWLEQAHLMGESLMYCYSLPKFFNKIACDMSDAQLEDGLVPDIAPEYTKFPGGFRDSPEWGSACILVPWQCYRWYGDRAILERHYPMMQKYLAYLGSKATDHILDHGLGDWYDLGPNPPSISQLTPIALTATATYFQDAQAMRQIATILGKQEDAVKYQVLSDQIREAFLKKFYDPSTKRIATSSQTSMAMPVAVGLVPQADVPGVIENLVADIRKNDNALTSGDVGYYYLLKALADSGRSDVIFDMNSRSDRPGYGYILNRGATALTEAWTGRESSSQNHFMLGHLMAWFYSGLTGITQAPDSIAFEKIIISPAFVGNIDWAKASFISERGEIRVEWRRENGKRMVRVSIPPNCTAKVLLDKTYDVESGEHEFVVME